MYVSDFERVGVMILNRLAKFILSDDFKNSNWAGDCLFPKITKSNLTTHPLIVANRVKARREVLNPLIFILLFLCGGILGSWVLVNDIKPPVPFIVSFGYVSSMIIVPTSIFMCLRNLSMTSEEKKSLKIFRETLWKWEEMTGDTLSRLLKRDHSSMEYFVDQSLVNTALKLIKLEQQNSSLRINDKLTSFDLEKEQEARKKFEDYFHLVLPTNLTVIKEYGPYFQKAKEKLAKEEQKNKGDVNNCCLGCGG